MAQNEIISKLNTMLTATRVFDSEMKIVYFLVEAKKVIDHGGDRTKEEFLMISFYRDWAVHTEKSRSFRGLEQLFEELYASCERTIVQGAPTQKLIDFLYFKDLRSSLMRFFREFHLDFFTITDPACWLSFVKKLAAILQDQPIHSIPNSKIEGIAIGWANDTSANIGVFFKQPIKDRKGVDHWWIDLTNGF